jgi:hypothetical protein
VLPARIASTVGTVEVMMAQLKCFQGAHGVIIRQCLVLKIQAPVLLATCVFVKKVLLRSDDRHFDQ